MLSIPSNTMISPAANKTWEKWTSRLAEPPEDETKPVEGFHEIQDTVGAVALYGEGEYSAGVSRSSISSEI
jgi:isoaspartyl peptidase/L-asparaginase-like protein (Ntn-hydrolase superfamily)